MRKRLHLLLCQQGMGCLLDNECAQSVESVGVFLCPTDFTDLYRFLCPGLSSFQNYCGW